MCLSPSSHHTVSFLFLFHQVPLLPLPTLSYIPCVICHLPQVETLTALTRTMVSHCLSIASQTHNTTSHMCTTLPLTCVQHYLSHVYNTTSHMCTTLPLTLPLTCVQHYLSHVPFTHDNVSFSWCAHHLGPHVWNISAREREGHLWTCPPSRHVGPLLGTGRDQLVMVSSLLSHSPFNRGGCLPMSSHCRYITMCISGSVFGWRRAWDTNCPSS